MAQRTRAPEDRAPAFAVTRASGTHVDEAEEAQLAPDGSTEDSGAEETGAGLDPGAEVHASQRDGPDLRNHRRVRAVKLVQYKRFDPDHVAEKLITELGLGKTLDVSEGGLKFICTTPLPTSWGLHIDLAFGDNEIVSVEGRIIHVEEVSEHRYRVGVKFTNLTDAVRDKLKRMVADRASRSAPGVR